MDAAHIDTNTLLRDPRVSAAIIDAMEAGKVEGYRRGLEDGRQDGYRTGYDVGHHEGYADYEAELAAYWKPIDPETEERNRLWVEYNRPELASMDQNATPPPATEPPVRD